MKNTVYQNKGTAIALGSFDGVHIGHRSVIENAVNSPYDAIAFIINNAFSICDKTFTQKLIESIGAKCVFADFEGIKNMDGDEFIDYLCKEFDAKRICCGENFRFGKGRKFAINDLEKICAKKGVELVSCPLVEVDSKPISSSAIRQEIKNGSIKNATKVLGHDYCFSSRVVSGDKRGRTMGIPTVNQKLDKSLILPPFGVWSSQTQIDEKKYLSVTNIGIRPTFLADEPLAETFIIDFSGNLYGKQITVSIFDFLRGEQVFDSKEDLREQIMQDICHVKSMKKQSGK